MLVVFVDSKAFVVVPTCRDLRAGVRALRVEIPGLFFFVFLPLLPARAVCVCVSNVAYYVRGVVSEGNKRHPNVGVVVALQGVEHCDARFFFLERGAWTPMVN